VQARSNKELIALYYRFAARTLKAAQSRMLLCADTRELAAAYQQITGLPVLELPNPMDVGSLIVQSNQMAPSAAEAPVVVYQGHTSPLRGFHFLPDIIERCAALAPRPRFIVQVQNRAGAASTGLGPALVKLDRLAAGGNNLRLVEGALSPGDYFALLAEADIVLLPYTPTFYGVGSSGVFTEAASLGKVIVVSPKTVPSRQGAEYGLGVVTATQWTPGAIRDLPALKAKGAAAAPRFRSEQCAEVLWNRVLAALPSVPGP
jgi:glycosyltransferase involved in cell wall biosynthesis